MENIQLIKNNGEQILEITSEIKKQIDAQEYLVKLKKQKELYVKQRDIFQSKIDEIDLKIERLLKLGVKE